MAPAVLKTPSMSRLQMQAVVKRCQGLQSNTTQMPKVTRQNKKCSSCVNLEAKLTHERKEHESQLERERDAFKVKSMRLQQEVERLKNKVQTIELQLENAKQDTVRARGDRHGDVDNCVYAAVLSGLQYWQFRRFFQITGRLGLCDRKKWDRLVKKLYVGIKQVVEWSTSYLIIKVKGLKTPHNSRSCAADVRWSHVGAHARHCTAIIVDVDEDFIVASINLSKDNNKYDDDMETWTGLSGAM